CWSFLFSSRRRHTRFSRDWSSDVCSSDLGETGVVVERADFPDAAFLRVLEKVDPLRPDRGAAVVAEHRERPPAALRRLAAGIEEIGRAPWREGVCPSVCRRSLS